MLKVSAEVRIFELLDFGSVLGGIAGVSLDDDLPELYFPTYKNHYNQAFALLSLIVSGTLLRSRNSPIMFPLISQPFEKETH